MTSPATPEGTTERQVVRTVSGGWLGGVCSGLAEHTGVPAVWWRVSFVVLASWRLVGVLAYLLLWLFLPRDTDASESPGLDAARRGGLRRRRPSNRVQGAELGPAFALASIGAGLTWLVQAMGWGLPWPAFWTGILVSAAVAAVWWQADWFAPLPSGTGWGWTRSLISHWTTVVTVVFGLTGMAIGVGIVVASLPDLGNVARTLWAIGLSIGALAVLAAPWVMRLRASLAAARQAQLLSDARADMAAHLHDSVLQTLALIQRQSHDPVAVARLARRQERELREWLYGVSSNAETVAVALNQAAQEVEDAFPVRVECVTVGDAPLVPSLSELVNAAREAMVNAAKHSGANLVDVYAEVSEDGGVELFVRDRGRGFDPDAVPEDRMGVRGSIVERMQRHGGRAKIRSDAEGTEVILEMEP
jgi:signal transduction histidine kinase/phage shock protein PspC (stress-responsive transcriptional regulator)